MKKLIFVLVLASCTQKPIEDINENNVMLQEPEREKVDEGKDEGLVLIERSDCLSCHKADMKMIGPSYKEIADKYTETDIDYLSKKIIEGGKGVWGEVPMPPHSGMNEETAQKMVKYILSQKKF